MILIKPYQLIAPSIISELESKMKSKYFELWKSLLHISPKLSFYKTFKEYYEEEKYLNVLNNFEDNFLQNLE